MNKKIFSLIGIILILVPLGLLTDSPAWGEWGSEYYEKVLGFIPKGMQESSSIKPFLPDYSISGVNDVVGYYVSAIVGVVLIFVIWLIIGKLIAKKESLSN